MTTATAVERKPKAAKKPSAKKPAAEKKPPKPAVDRKALERSMAKAGEKIVVTADGGKGHKAKGQRHEVKSVITCHGGKFYRCVDGAGKAFHLSPASAEPVK
jgi:hypothetical protein